MVLIETNNDLAHKDNYQNIILVCSLSPANWHLFEEIQQIIPGNNPADCIPIKIIYYFLIISVGKPSKKGEKTLDQNRISIIFRENIVLLQHHSMINSLQIILDSLHQQAIMVGYYCDAIGPMWSQQNQENVPTHLLIQTNEHDENSASARPTKNEHDRRSP